MPSERLIALLRHVRAPETDMTWRGVAAALGDLYHPQMSLPDVVHHLAAAYTELTEEPRFAVPAGPVMLANLLLAPIKGLNSIDMLGPRSTDHAYSVEAIYNSLAGHMLGAFMFAKTGWCADLIAVSAAPVAEPPPPEPRRPLCRDCADEVVRQQTPNPICPNDGKPCGF